MKNERRNKRLYKTISCIIVFFVCVFAFVSLAISKASNNKVNAGVIIEEQYNIYSNNEHVRIEKSIIQGNNFQLGVLYHEDGQSTIYFAIYPAGTTYNNTSYSYFYIRLNGFRGDINSKFLVRLDLVVPNQYAQQTGLTTIFSLWYDANIIVYNELTYIAIDYDLLLTKVSESNQNWASFFENTDYNIYAQYIGSRFFTTSASIKSVSNIFELPENALTLLYINDVSGLNTSALRDEITINWGYINSNDNTLYAEHAPTISAQNMQTDDKIIRLGVPLNAAGDAIDFYDISQQALLNISSLPEGSATAQAHIYGVYVWHNSNNIKWGLAEFNTQVDPVPGSALNMNYITSLTELYDFQTLDTMNMTCRLSVSSNFNFITIKNQTNGPDKDSINSVIQQGGFLPAWSVYNWARGTYSGFIAGDASARADYAEGKPGYDAIYQAGFSDGFANAELGTANWFITSFKAVDAFLSIHIFPNITFGVLLGIPFVISLAWFIIRMFRGGGGD